MSESKDIRFTEKKVDESWKETIEKDKGTTSHSSEKPTSNSKSPQTSKTFMQLVSSLGYQALMNLGEMDPSGMGQAEVDLQAAREVIDLLIGLKEKTQGNLSPEENQLIESIIPELQMKYVSKS